jgi:hypothetical protein
VVALALGIGVRYVTIDRAEAVEASGDPSAAGHTALEPYRGDAGRLAAVAFAGIASDATFGFPGAIIEGDPAAAIAAVACYSPLDVAAFRCLVPTQEAQRAASLLAQTILRRRRGDIIALGRELAKKRRLSSEETSALLQQHPDSRRI